MKAIKQGAVYWITGLSGAGKTTLGTLLYEHIKKIKPNVFFLDGDIGRKTFNDGVGYSRDDREQGAYRSSRVCKMIADQGIDVVCSTISMFDGVRDWNRQNMPVYREIFLDVPLDILIKRDQKGLYTRVKEGKENNVVGMDLKLEFPQNPDLKFINDGRLSPEETLEEIVRNFSELREIEP